MCQIPKRSLAGVACFLLAALASLPVARAADIKPVPGPDVISPERRPVLAPGHPWACSERYPVCVHATAPTLAPQVLPTLRDLEDVVARVHGVLRWPAPLRDGSLGGNESFDVYLTPVAPPFFHVVPDDPDLWTELDRTSAFALVQPSLPDACFRSEALAEAYARAGLFAVDAGGQHGLANATAAFVASEAFDCPVSWLADVDDVQDAPQDAVSSTRIDHGRGNLLFPWFLQETRGMAGSVDLLHAIWLLSAQHTDFARTRFVNEPDLLDVLARLQDGRTATLDDLLLEYAVDRAFVGDRDDGLHMPETRFLGSAGAVRFDASVPWSMLPRSITPAVPIEPTGSSYVWLDLTSAPKDAGLIVQARWELPTRFMFSLLRIGSDGSPVTQVNPPTLQRATEAQFTIDDVGGVAGLLIVACNTGPNLADLAFDPDTVPYSSSAYSLALYPKK